LAEKEEKEASNGAAIHAITRPMQQAIDAARTELQASEASHVDAERSLTDASMDGARSSGEGSAASNSLTHADASGNIAEDGKASQEAMDALERAHKARCSADEALERSSRAHQTCQRSLLDVQSTRESARLGREVLQTDQALREAETKLRTLEHQFDEAIAPINAEQGIMPGSEDAKQKHPR